MTPNNASGSLIEASAHGAFDNSPVASALATLRRCLLAVAVAGSVSLEMRQPRANGYEKSTVRTTRRFEMKKNSTPAKTIDEYIAAFPADVQSVLQQIRTVVRIAVPDAQEAIKYRIPTFVLGENLVHFAAFKNHISFFPTSSGIRQFKKQLARFHTSKGTVQFPLGRPVPYPLLRKIAVFRAKEAKAKQR